MPPKVCVNKLKREMKDFISSPPPSIPAIFVNERNMLGACCCNRCWVACCLPSMSSFRHGDAAQSGTF
jgi:hypothetical protein